MACAASGRRRSSADFEPDSSRSALLNDDDNDVGAVHLGLVYAADAQGRPVAIRETDKLVGRVRHAGRGRRSRRQLETWSALLFDFLTTDGTLEMRDNQAQK